MIFLIFFRNKNNLTFKKKGFPHGDLHPISSPKSWGIWNFFKKSEPCPDDYPLVIYPLVN
jgi:hypothetical protein